jgi:hypothetical protein
MFGLVNFSLSHEDHHHHHHNRIIHKYIIQYICRHSAQQKKLNVFLASKYIIKNIFLEKKRQQLGTWQKNCIHGYHFTRSY